jgi:hypothetical protein
MKPMLILTALIASVACAQQPPIGGDTQAVHDVSNIKAMSGSTTESQDGDGSAGMAAMNAMDGTMNMGPHMKMTDLRPARPGDAERAQHVVEVAREVSTKYLDYHVALADGFAIFHPELPQKIYHFVNRDYAGEAAVDFNPEHPTALLYEKHADDYKLIGVMYTAPRRFSQDQLDQRIPLSIAQWHEHVNFCSPPPPRRQELLDPHSEFGLAGSISTQQACDAAGGTFHPVIFNWMVHVYPFEKDQKSIWSVERQRDGN